MENSDIASTVHVHNPHYGSAEVPVKQLYDFPQGVIGFSSIQNYALISIEETDFYVLQAVTDSVSFIVIPAGEVDPTYSIQVDDHTMELLEADGSENIVPFLIVNMIEDRPHVNLKAPVLLSTASQKGCQYIAANSEYPIRYPLLTKENG